MSYFTIENLAFHNFQHIHLNLTAGECIGLTGPSGIGKSLFLRALADLDPFQGDIYLEGVSSNSIPAPTWRQQVALLPAEAAWWFETVGEHLNGISSDWLPKLGFGQSVLRWKISRLSSGEKQRLALLRLLNNQPKVLLLDEPTANLDSENSRRVELMITGIRKRDGVAVIWVSHDIEQLKRVSDRRFILKSEGLKEVVSEIRLLSKKRIS